MHHHKHINNIPLIYITRIEQDLGMKVRPVVNLVVNLKYERYSTSDLPDGVMYIEL
jgi:hypothetical protein